MAHDKDRVWFARDVLRLLLKAIKMRSFYGPDHVHARAARDEVRGALRGFVALHQQLRLEVRRDSLLVGDERVYEEANRDANFATGLFSAGVRELKVTGEPADAELERLLAILAARTEQADVASLLWEADFEHIETVCLDELAEGWQAPENLSAAAQRRIVEMNLRAEEIVADLRARNALGSGTVTYELTDTGRELDAVPEGSPGNEEDEDEAPQVFTVPEDQVEELRDEVESQGSDEVLRALVAVILDGLALAPEELGEETARWFLAEAPLAALRSRDLSLLADILERYDQELRLRYPRELAGVRARLSAAIEPALRRVTEGEGAIALPDLVVASAVGGPSAFCRAARVLGRAGVAAAVTAYLATTTRETRDALNRFLVEVGPSAPDELIRLVGAGSDAETAKWALFLAGKHLRGALAESLYATAQSHADAAVRDYAAFQWRTATPAGRLKAFQDALDSPNPAERIRAAETLARSGDKEAYETLKKLVDDSSFLGRTPDEKRAFLAAVATLGGAGAKDFLRKQTERPTGIFRRRAGAEVREEAARVLRDLTGGAQPRPGPPPGGKP